MNKICWVVISLLGLATHRAFDQLAIDAEDLGDGVYALKQLADLTQNCLACHAVHRLQVSHE